MTRWLSTRQRGPTKPKVETPPVWRGIGCLLIVMVPVIAWILASATIELALTNGWALPYQLLGFPVMPALLWKVSAFAPILYFIEHQAHLYMKLVLTLAFIVVMSALMSAAYSIVYRMVGPSPLGPYDAPQPQVKVGRYKR